MTFYEIIDFKSLKYFRLFKTPLLPTSQSPGNQGFLKYTIKLNNNVISMRCKERKSFCFNIDKYGDRTLILYQLSRVFFAVKDRKAEWKKSPYGLG